MGKRIFAGAHLCIGRTAVDNDNYWDDLLPPNSVLTANSKIILLDEMPVNKTKCLILWPLGGLQIGVPFPGFPDYWCASVPDVQVPDALRPTKIK